MKKLITILFLFAFSLQAQITEDKYYHAGAGVIISSGMCVLDYHSKRDMNPIAPTLAAFSVGFFKELADGYKPNGRFSGQDLLFTTASAAIVNIGYKLIFKKKKKKRIIEI